MFNWPSFLFWAVWVIVNCFCSYGLCTKKNVYFAQRFKMAICDIGLTEQDVGRKALDITKWFSLAVFTIEYFYQFGLVMNGYVLLTLLTSWLRFLFGIAAFALANILSMSVGVLCAYVVCYCPGNCSVALVNIGHLSIFLGCNRISNIYLPLLFRCFLKIGKNHYIRKWIFWFFFSIFRFFGNTVVLFGLLFAVVLPS